MINVLNLIAKIVTNKSPLRTLYWGGLNWVSRNLKTGQRRYEFERLYAELGDPWNYEKNEYEREKYTVSLEALSRYVHAGAIGLEVGCSIGVFSRKFAPRCKSLVCIDVSSEALKIAHKKNDDLAQIGFVHSDIRTFESREKFDVIVCAEVLYYVPKKDQIAVVVRLFNLLKPGGILLCVGGSSDESHDYLHSSRWVDNLRKYFIVLEDCHYNKNIRPYRVTVLRKEN
jgi:2-polyprenyl-3-methyl-5-hydroxy-6-metoxy-1,4-benzoquinol methylase